MKNEKPRGTMLTSTASILCALAFAAGFLCGDIVSEYRNGAGAVAVQTSAQQGAPQTVVEAGSSKASDVEAHIADLREQVKKSPNDASLWTHLGNYCYDSGRFDEAIEAYSRSLALAPGDPDVITDLGSMYRMKGQSAEAVKYYEQAIALKPDHANAVFNKGVTLLLDMEKPEEAMAFWNSVLAASPHFALNNGTHLHAILHELASDAGVQLEAHGRFEPALRAYAEALKIKPDFLPALVHQAWLLEQTGRPAEALPVWKKVLELDPTATDPAGKPVSSRIQ